MPLYQNSSGGSRVPANAPRNTDPIFSIDGFFLEKLAKYRVASSSRRLVHSLGNSEAATELQQATEQNAIAAHTPSYYFAS